MNCPKCNTQLADKSKFCNECGFDMSGINSRDTSARPIMPSNQEGSCHKCGYSNSLDMKFCVNCGLNFKDYAELEKERQAKLEQERLDKVAAFKAKSGITMVEIPAGSFRMGSPKNEKGRDNDEKQHKVTISKPFLMSKTEVTQKQWQAVMGNNPSCFSGDDNPVEEVSWYDCVKFCNKLSEKDGLEPVYNIKGWIRKNVTWDKNKNGYRLPTEAEWEYACRAGTTTRFNTGESDSDLKKAGWFSENSSNKTNPVAKKKPNSFGLYDIAHH